MQAVILHILHTFNLTLHTYYKNIFFCLSQICLSKHQNIKDHKNIHSFILLSICLSKNKKPKKPTFRYVLDIPSHLFEIKINFVMNTLWLQNNIFFSCFLSFLFILYNSFSNNCFCFVSFCNIFFFFFVGFQKIFFVSNFLQKTNKIWVHFWLDFSKDARRKLLKKS